MLLGAMNAGAADQCCGAMALGATEGEGPGRPCVGSLHGAAAQCCGAKGPGGAAIAAPAPLAPQCCGAMETANTGAHLAPSPPLRSQGPWRHKTNLRHQSSWHRSVGPPFATLAARGTRRHAGRLCGAIGAAVPWLVAPQNGLGFENTFSHRLFS